MNEEQKKNVVADVENIEALRDFFEEWWTVEELYETAAKATQTLMFLTHKIQLCEEDRETLERFTNQYLMMVETMKPFARKEGDDYGKQ